MKFDINKYPEREVNLQNKQKPCFICNSMTNFTDEYTGLYVCSDECLKQLQEKTDDIDYGRINRW